MPMDDLLFWIAGFCETVFELNSLTHSLARRPTYQESSISRKHHLHNGVHHCTVCTPFVCELIFPFSTNELAYQTSVPRITMQSTKLREVTTSTHFTPCTPRIKTPSNTSAASQQETTIASDKPRGFAIKVTTGTIHQTRLNRLELSTWVRDLDISLMNELLCTKESHGIANYNVP